MADLGSGEGGFFGGLASGMMAQRAQNLAQQKQDFVEKTTATQQAEDYIQKTLQIAQDTVKAAADAGKDPKTIAAAIQPLIASAAELGSRVGGPQYAQRIQNMGTAMLARPAANLSPDKNYSVVKGPVDPNTGFEAPMVFNPATGEARPLTANPAAPSANLTAPGTTITGVSVTGSPSSAFPSSQGAPATPTPNTRVAGGFGDLNTPQAAIPDAASQPTAQPTPAPQPQGAGGLTADAIDFRARQYVAGNPDALKGLPRSKMGMVVMSAIVNRATMLAKQAGLSPEDVNSKQQEFKAQTAGAQVLGKRDATLAGSIALVTATAPIVADLSSKIDRTQYPLINKIMMAGKEQTGDPTVVRLGIALNTVTNGYARAQGGGNNALTDSAREEARNLLQMSYSDGQLQAGIDQLLTEMQREKHEVGDAMKGYLKLKEEQIKSSVSPAAPVHTIVTPSGGKFRIVQ